MMENVIEILKFIGCIIIIIFGVAFIAALFGFAGAIGFHVMDFMGVMR